MTNQKKISEHAEFSVTQKAVMFDPESQKFLLLRIAETSGYFAQHYGVWDMAGGRPHIGESLEEAMNREVIEELGEGVRCDFEDVVGVDMLAYGEGRPVLAIGRLTLYRGGDITLSQEHSDYRWVSSEEIAEDKECGEWVRRFVMNAAERLKEREYLNDAKRIYADFENYRRRQEERVKGLSNMNTEKIALDIIPVIDNFRAAAAHVPQGEVSGAWMTGITCIGKQIEDVLAGHGLMMYEAREGDSFDPYLHEAVSHEKGDEDGKIVKALQPGYKIGTKVIRPAKVVVA